MQHTWILFDSSLSASQKFDQKGGKKVHQLYCGKEEEPYIPSSDELFSDDVLTAAWCNIGRTLDVIVDPSP